MNYAYKANILWDMGIMNFSINEKTGELDYCNPPLTDEQKATLEKRFKDEYDLIALRDQRNLKLKSCDWTQGADVPDKIKTAWATYRQALRDLPANTSDQANPTWPTKPS